MQNIERDLPGSPAEVPKKLTFVGASLMFFAVVTVALARLPARQLPQPQPDAAATEEAELKVERSPSLASFAASEYVEREALGLGLKNVYGKKAGFWYRSRFLRFLSPLRKMPGICLLENAFIPESV